jgi:hypothetical protein
MKSNEIIIDDSINLQLRILLFFSIQFFFNKMLNFNEFNCDISVNSKLIISNENEII